MRVIELYGRKFCYKLKRAAVICRVYNIFKMQYNLISLKLIKIPAGIYLLKVNNRNIRTSCGICSKLTIKTPDRRPLNMFHTLF